VWTHPPRSDVAICPECHGHLRPCTLPSILAGKFAVARQIGVGGMGIVYEAHDLDLGRPVALKTLPKVAPQHVARLRREARAMATIHHPHLAVIYAIEVWRGVPVLVIEYLSGGTLADRLDAGPLPIDDALTMAIAMADVLDHVHRAGMLHRDVKPRNIGYTGDAIPKLLDFGLVRLTSVSAAADDTTSLAVLHDAQPGDGSRGGESRGATEPLVGTASYLSPEAVSLHPPDHSFDLWALGVTLYEAISGGNPLGRADTGRDAASHHVLTDTAGPKCERRLSGGIERLPRTCAVARRAQAARYRPPNFSKDCARSSGPAAVGPASTAELAG
jgi:serine/threonine-protein kinase